MVPIEKLAGQPQLLVRIRDRCRRAFALSYTRRLDFAKMSCEIPNLAGGRNERPTIATHELELELNEVAEIGLRFGGLADVS